MACINCKKNEVVKNSKLDYITTDHIISSEERVAKCNLCPFLTTQKTCDACHCGAKVSIMANDSGIDCPQNYWLKSHSFPKNSKKKKNEIIENIEIIEIIEIIVVDGEVNSEI